MGALTKAEISLELTEKLGINNRESKELVEAFFEEIRRSLEAGKDVKLSGFGNFILRHKKARPGRNPKTGEDKEISERTVVTFRPGQKLRARIDQMTLDDHNAQLKANMQDEGYLESDEAIQKAELEDEGYHDPERI